MPRGAGKLRSHSQDLKLANFGCRLIKVQPPLIKADGGHFSRHICIFCLIFLLSAVDIFFCDSQHHALPLCSNGRRACLNWIEQAGILQFYLQKGSACFHHSANGCRPLVHLMPSNLLADTALHTAFVSSLHCERC